VRAYGVSVAGAVRERSERKSRRDPKTRRFEAERDIFLFTVRGYWRITRKFKDGTGEKARC